MVKTKRIKNQQLVIHQEQPQIVVQEKNKNHNHTTFIGYIYQEYSQLVYGLVFGIVATLSSLIAFDYVAVNSGGGLMTISSVQNEAASVASKHTESITKDVIRQKSLWSRVTGDF